SGGPRPVLEWHDHHGLSGGNADLRRSKSATEKNSKHNSADQNKTIIPGFSVGPLLSPRQTGADQRKLDTSLTPVGGPQWRRRRPDPTAFPDARARWRT